MVTVHGDVDMKTARGLRGAIADAAQDGKPRLIVDMSEVRFMDSSGLAALMGAYRALRARTHMVVVCRENLRRIFEVSRFDHVVPIVGSLPEALVA